jgi:MoxR-like ATPase
MTDQPSPTPPADGATPEAGASDLEAVERLKQGYETIVGQDAVIDELLVSIFARGHCLLVGVPGLAKTLLISTLAGRSA